MGVLSPQAVASTYLDAVVEHCERFLVHGRDRFGPRHTPLFVDGLDVRRLEAAEFVYGGRADGAGGGCRNKLARRDQMPGERWILSNLASQADFFRVLDGLSSITGDPRFREGAEGALEYGLRELRARSGLLYWGGHIAYDCGRDVPVAEQTEHELKCHFPYYALMAEVDRRRTLDFVDAFWNAHVLDWRSLDMNRHGSEFFWKPPRIRMWRRPYRPPPVPFEGDGRAFCNTACDMMAAAAFRYQKDGNQRALRWAERLAQRYADARHEVTGLGGRQFTTTGDDRARAQFSAEFGAIANDANILSPAMMVFRYGRLPVCYLNIAEQVGGEVGDTFRRLAVEDLIAFGLHAYDADANMIHAMFTDGRRIELNAVVRAGHYYDPTDPGRITKMRCYRVGGTFLWAYAMAYRRSVERRLLPT